MVVSSSNPHSKEVSIRRRIASIFNKREEDFPSLREYNDYLEEVEDMKKKNDFVAAFNLIEGIDVPAIEEKIAKYQEENSEQIMINRARKAEELAAAMAASKGPLAQSDNDGGPTQNSQTGLSAQGQYAPTVAGGQPRPTGMAPQPLPLGMGTDMHGYALDDDEMMKLRAERGGRAGGWSVELSRKRAIEEAFSSIWIY
ncbi:Cdk-activating kinase assembly factor [Trema orientale]|uniref:Cdk-activating kinase assembly factor n=1 Tax=Trema orientale TaxID=63057 RepID=A0A2P5FNE0_TREOI|nr:Cdk-activating kinase assembly factor [Trema orientale]